MTINAISSAEQAAAALRAQALNDLENGSIGLTGSSGMDSFKNDLGHEGDLDAAQETTPLPTDAFPNHTSTPIPATNPHPFE